MDGCVFSSPLWLRSPGVFHQNHLVLNEHKPGPHGSGEGEGVSERVPSQSKANASLRTG